MKKTILLLISICNTFAVSASARRVECQGLQNVHQDDRTKGEKNLHKAIENGNYKAVKKALLRDKVDPNKRNPEERGGTPLHMAAERNLSKIVRLLLLHPDIQIYKNNHRGETVLHAAAKGDSIRSIRFILSHESLLRATDPEYATDDYISLLHTVNKNHQTPLHTSVMYNAHRATAFFLRRARHLNRYADRHGKYPNDYDEDSSSEN